MLREEHEVDFSKTWITIINNDPNIYPFEAAIDKEWGDVEGVEKLLLWMIARKFD